MDLENIVNLNKNINENCISQEQNNFLESNLGKIINSALDVGLRMILPNFVEESVVEIKDTFLKNGFKEGISTAINNAINLGKSILGIFTGDFDNISQARDPIKSAGIIDGISNFFNFLTFI